MFHAPQWDGMPILRRIQHLSPDLACAPAHLSAGLAFGLPRPTISCHHVRSGSVREIASAIGHEIEVDDGWIERASAIRDGGSHGIRADR